MSILLSKQDVAHRRKSPLHIVQLKQWTVTSKVCQGPLSKTSRYCAVPRHRPRPLQETQCILVVSGLSAPSGSRRDGQAVTNIYQSGDREPRPHPMHTSLECRCGGEVINSLFLLPSGPTPPRNLFLQVSAPAPVPQRLLGGRQAVTLSAPQRRARPR